MRFTRNNLAMGCSEMPRTVAVGAPNYLEAEIRGVLFLSRAGPERTTLGLKFAQVAKQIGVRVAVQDRAQAPPRPLASGGDELVAAPPMHEQLVRQRHGKPLCPPTGGVGIELVSHRLAPRFERRDRVLDAGVLKVADHSTPGSEERLVG